MREEHHVSFKDLTTFKVGGIAKKVLYPENEEEFLKVLKEEKEFYILGGGSNVLAPEGEYMKTIIIPSYTNIESDEEGTKVHMDVTAGVSWDRLVSQTVQNNLWGIENLSGIPGTVGGAVFQNIGAYGAVLSDVVDSIKVYDIEEGTIRTLFCAECEFGYRTSLFKKQKDRYVILSANLIFKKHGEPNLSYKDLALQFANDPSPRISSIRAAVLTIRKRKFPDLNEYGTAGSFFLNPVVSEEEGMEFQEKYPTITLSKLPEGGVKVPLAWILDNVINAKEMRVGNAFVWKEQALVIATEDGATARDVKRLQKEVAEKVFTETNIHITPEVRIL